MESPERGRGMAQARSSPHSSHSLRERQEGDSMPTLDDIILGHRKKGQIETNRGGGAAFLRLQSALCFPSSDCSAQAAVSYRAFI